MSAENIQPIKKITWEDYKQNLSERDPGLIQMIDDGRLRAEWLEDKNGNPEFLKVFYPDGTTYLVEDVQQMSAKFQRNKATKLDGTIQWEVGNLDDKQED